VIARNDVARQLGISKGKLAFLTRLLGLRREDRAIPGRKWEKQAFYDERTIHSLELLIDLCNEKGIEVVVASLSGGQGCP